MYCTVRWIHIEVDIWSWHLRHLIKYTAPSVPLYWCMKLSSSGVLQNFKGKFSQVSALRCGMGLGKNLWGEIAAYQPKWKCPLCSGREVLCCCVPHGVPRVFIQSSLLWPSQGRELQSHSWSDWPIWVLWGLSCQIVPAIVFYRFSPGALQKAQQKSVALLYSLLEN